MGVLLVGSRTPTLFSNGSFRRSVWATNFHPSDSWGKEAKFLKYLAYNRCTSGIFIYDICINIYVQILTYIYIYCNIWMYAIDIGLHLYIHTDCQITSRSLSLLFLSWKFNDKPWESRILMNQRGLISGMTEFEHFSHRFQGCEKCLVHPLFFPVRCVASTTCWVFASSGGVQISWEIQNKKLNCSQESQPLFPRYYGNRPGKNNTYIYIYTY